MTSSIARAGIGLSVFLVSTLLPNSSLGQVIKTFNNTDVTWINPGAWTPSGPPGAADTAQFATLGTTSGVLNQPVLNSSTSIGQFALSNTAFGDSWTLTGTGSLTAGAVGVSGLVARGVGNYSINLGDGTANSLNFTGSTGGTLTGALNIGRGSTVTLTGNTVATLGSSNIGLRGGNLILDNAAGNPVNQRLTGSGNINLFGGGSTLEFRSATGGSDFTGLTGILSLVAGDGVVRVNQTGSGPLNVTFGSLDRANTSSTINFQNAGNGTLGAGGATDPSVKFTTAPPLTNNVIANTAGSAALGFAIYNGSDFAGYSATNGVIPVVSTPVSGTLSNAATQNSRLVGNASISGSVSYNSLKISPSAAGQALTINTGGALSTVAILLAGSVDYSITGGTVGSSSGTRYLYVTDPNTTLFLSSSLAVNSSVNKSGDGFLILTGTSSQVAFTSSQALNLTGGTLRVNSTNYSFTAGTPPTTRFRGGVLEYDVSGGSFTFNRGLGTVSNTVNWTAGTNLGSGGFSAFSSNPANALTVNLGNAGATLTWGGVSGLDVNFVQDGHALLFGSTKSNATVNWLNPLNLDSGTAGSYLVREISVTKGVGNAADLTRLNGAIAGTATTDLLKTGTGVLVLAANNTYAGNTQINRGTLQVTGSVVPNTGSSNVFVHPNGTLGGTGTLGSAGNNVSVFAAGVVAPGTSTGVLTINGNLTFTSSATYAAELGGTAANAFDQSVVNGSVVLNGAALSPSLVNGYTPANGDTLFIVLNDASDSVSGQFNNIPQDGTVNFGGYSAQVSYTGNSATNALSGGNDIVLYNFNVSTVPELSTYALLALTFAGFGAAYGWRRGRVTSPSPETTPAPSVP